MKKGGSKLRKGRVQVCEKKVGLNYEKGEYKVKNGVLNYEKEEYKYKGEKRWF